MKFKILFLFVEITMAALLAMDKDDSVEKPPKFADSYTLSGILVIPYPGIREPFDSYYDMKAKKSRIDYYNGLTKTYQRPEIPPYGMNFKVVHVTTETYANRLECIALSGSLVDPILPQSLIPNLNEYQLYNDTVTCGDTKCEHWEKIITHFKVVTKYTFLVTKNGKPFQFLVNGSDKYEYRYLNYTPRNLDPAIFDVDYNLNCTTIKSPTAEDFHYHNPTKELIDNNDTHVDRMFEDFKLKHGKQYESQLKQINRKIIFKQNLRYIDSLNRAGNKFKLAINYFGDLTRDELMRMRGRLQSDIKKYNEDDGIIFSKDKYFKNVVIPNSVDWRAKGAVTPVKDQAKCSSSWSFGATGAVEGAYFRTTGNLVSLSEQALVDCSWGFDNYGCDGGVDVHAYQWITKHGGIPTNESYGPYLAQDGLCQLENVTKIAAIQDIIRIPEYDTDSLKYAIAMYGPVSVSIDASSTNFQFYSNGVLYDRSCGKTITQLNHVVLVVGYGVLNGEPYWLIKNSWSSQWGNEGYIMLSQRNNNCGVGTAAIFVILKGEGPSTPNLQTTTASTRTSTTTTPRATYAPTTPSVATTITHLSNWWLIIIFSHFFLQSCVFCIFVKLR